MARGPLARTGIVVLIAVVFGFAAAHDAGAAHEADPPASTAHAVSEMGIHIASGVCAAAAALLAVGLLVSGTWRRLTRIHPLGIALPSPIRPEGHGRGSTRGVLFELCVLRA